MIKVALKKVDGVDVAWVDGIKVRPAAGQDIVDVAHARVQQLATHLGVSAGKGQPKKVLVQATAPGGSWQYVYDEAGAMTVEVAETPKPERHVPEPSTAPTNLARRGSSRIAARAPEAPRAPGKARRQLPSWAPVAVIIAAGLLVVTALVFGLFGLLGGGSASNVSMETKNVQLTATPPLEWSPQATWRSPALAADTGRALVVGGDRVALVIDDPRAVALVEAATGKTLWSAELPEDKLAGDLHLTTIDGQQVIAVQAGNALHWWSVADGTAGDLGLPDGSTTTYYGTRPIVRVAPTQAALVTGGELADIAVPEQASILAARSDGTVTAVAPQGWWHLTHGGTVGNPQPWPYGSNQRVQPQPAAIMGGHIVTILAPTAKGQPLRTVIYRDGHEKVSWLFQSAINPPVGQTGKESFKPSTSLTWGIFGRSLIDIKRTTVTDLGPWQTVWVASDRAQGRVGSQAVIAGPSIPRGVLQGGESFVDDLTTAGGLVRAKSGDGQTYEYLLPPKQK